MKGKTAGQGNGKPEHESENGWDLKHEFTFMNDLRQIAWQAPVLGFIIYFTYFYLQQGILDFCIQYWNMVFSFRHLDYHSGKSLQISRQTVQKNGSGELSGYLRFCDFLDHSAS